jgi:hypothetical protein
MINAENIMFTRVSDRLEASFPDIFVTGDIIPSPSSFPAVSLVQEQNFPYSKSMDENTENHVIAIYEANVYSNLSKGRKSQAYTIARIIDDVFQETGFVRIELKPVPNFADKMIYRLVVRWKGVHNDRWVFRK